MWVYLYTTYDRQPWEDTIAWYKFEWDANDYSWNSRDLTASWNVSYTTISSWKTVAYSNWSISWNSTGFSNSFSSFSINDLTLNIWCNTSWNWNHPSWTYLHNRWILMRNNWTNWVYWMFTSGDDNAETYKLQWAANDATLYASPYTTLADWNWHNIVWVRTTTSLAFYIDWQPYSSSTISKWAIWINWFYIWKNNDGNYWFNWYYWDIIVEKKARTDSEILNHYNWTKGSFGVS